MEQNLAAMMAQMRAQNRDSAAGDLDNNPELERPQAPQKPVKPNSPKQPEKPGDDE